MKLKELKTFAKKIIKILKSIEVNPILYGSLLYLHYTKDKTIEINDIDFYVPEESFQRIMVVLKSNGIKYGYSKKYHTLQIFDDDLKIELDSINYWYDGPKDFISFNFDGLEINALSLKGLKSIYKKSKGKAKDKRESYAKKLNVLERLR